MEPLPAADGFSPSHDGDRRKLEKCLRTDDRTEEYSALIYLEERVRLTRTHLGTLGIYAAIAAVTALHYSTGEHAHHLHDIYRRLDRKRVVEGRGTDPRDGS